MMRLTLRNLSARKMRLVMSGLAIVLGVGFLSGVLVFSNGLSATFDSIVTGSTPSGVVRAESVADIPQEMPGLSAATLSPELVADIAAVPEVARADGDVSGSGLNLLSEEGKLVGSGGAPTVSFSYHDAPNLAGEPMLLLREGNWPTERGEVALDPKAAESGGYAVGDTVRLLTPTGTSETTATLSGIAEFAGGGMAGATLLVLSTPGAQAIFLDGQNAYTGVSLTPTDGVSQQEMVDAVATLVPDGFEVVTGDTVAEETKTAIGEFLNIINVFLLVFAVIAVLVGGFIIVNTFSILVAGRSRELALIRALGASRRQVRRSVLLEATVMAIIASTLGIAVGFALARGLAAVFALVGLDIASRALTLNPTSVISGYAVGILVTLVAAYLPARRASAVAPVAAMRGDHQGEMRSLRRRVIVGTVFVAIGAATAVAGLAFDAPGPPALWVGVAAVLWILTLAGMVSVVGRPVLLLGRVVFAKLFGMPGRLASENALRDPRRTGATASALMIGLALVSTISVLAASMNSSFGELVDEQFNADFIVQGPNFMPFSPAVGDALAEVDGVQSVSRVQSTFADLDGAMIGVTGIDHSLVDLRTVAAIAGEKTISAGDALITEEAADLNGLGVGDSITLTFTAGKTLSLTVAGVIEPVQTLAAISVPIDQLASAGVVRQDSVLSIMKEPGADAATVKSALEDAIEATPTVAVFDKESFSDAIRGQVNQLLYLIFGLLALAIVIAIIGIINTLGLSVMERTREIGLLRAIGMSRARLRRMITLESVTIAILGSVLGMALGLVIGTLLRESMKEDLTRLGLPVSQLAIFLVITVVVGVLAAVIPAIRASRLKVLDAIATE